MKIINTKEFKTLIVAFILGILLGIVSFILISNTAKIEINESLTNYISLIKENNYNYTNGIIKTFISNFKTISLIWIFGIVFICALMIPLLIIYRGVLLGFSISSIIYTFGIKGLLYSLILIITSNIVNELIYILMGYYSIKFAYKCFNAIKTEKSINLKQFVKKYFLIFIILLALLLLSSLFEVYVGSNIIKFVV